MYLQITDKAKSTKVCHKCAFEIEQCHTFVEKVKSTTGTSRPKRDCCILCFESYNKDTFFDLSKQKFGVNDFLQRIHALFTDEVSIQIKNDALNLMVYHQLTSFLIYSLNTEKSKNSWFVCPVDTTLIYWQIWGIYPKRYLPNWEL